MENLLKPCLDIKKDEEVVEKKESTQITFYSKIDHSSLKQINSNCPYENVSNVYTVSLDFTRMIDQTKIDVGQSVAIFPQNTEEDALKCI